MNTMKTFLASFAKGLTCLFMAAAFTSCYDDAALWAELEEINTKLEDLEASLNGQIEALNDLLAGGDITISECEENEDGSYNVTLSNGTEFSVFPKNKTLSGLVTVMDINGVRYWAAYNADGRLAPIKDDDGDNIPVSAVLPTVEKRDGVYYLIIDGKEYVTGHEESVTVITDYVINKDDSGNIYSATFTFGDENLTFTIPMADYKGFSFILGSVQTGGKTIKDLFVSYGATYQIGARLDGVVDYVLQEPAGWKVEEEDDAVDVYLNITAPSPEAVAAGSAVAEGYLKVVAVLEDGKAMIAKLYLTTEPFKTFTTTSTNVIIEKYNGVDKYLYGLTTFEKYDEEALFASADAMLKANDKGVTDGDINVALASVLGEEIVPETSYVLWAIPAFFDQNDDEAAPFVKEGLIKSYVFGGSAVKLEVKELFFNNADITLTSAGVEAYYGGTVPHSKTVMDDILYKVKNKTVNPVTGPFEYEGSAFSFPTAEMNAGVKPSSDSTYVTWMVPVNESGVYTVDNIICKEFTLKGVTAGGSTTVTPGTPTLSRVSVSVPVTSEGAERFYYRFLTKKESNRYSGQESQYLLKRGYILDAQTSAVLEAENLEPDTDYALFVMSTDEQGRYGAVKVEYFKTDKITYNDMTVESKVTEFGQNTAKVDVTVSGGSPDGYVYWIGKKSDPFWVNAEGNTDTEKLAYIQKYLALYPESMEKIMYNSPIVDGTITLRELKANTFHYVVVLAKDAEGNFSQSSVSSFTTLKANLGIVVREGDTKWAAAKSKIQIKWNKDSFRLAESSGMFAYYSFKIKCPTEYTAYILCMSDLYFDEKTFPTMEDRIIEIEDQCSRKYDASKVIYDDDGSYMEEPDWVDDNGEPHDGTLMNVYTFYVHGYPMSGFATYFAAGTHGQNNCTAWEDGHCYNYNRALESIAKRHTIDYYKQVVKDVRGGTCKSEATINKIAQDLMEAYLPYYENAEPAIFFNNGEYLDMCMPNASGVDEDGNVIDDVYVVLKDAQGNYYEPMSFEVPNYFE